MLTLSCDTSKGKLHVHVDASAEILGCLAAGLTAALPCFLEHFVACLSGRSTPGDLRPGGEPRC